MPRTNPNGASTTRTPRQGARPSGYPESVHTHLVISAGWALAIAEYASAQRGAGIAPNTVRSRIQHLQRVARSLPIEPWDLTAEQLLNWAGTQTWAAETRRGRYNTYRSFWAWGKATKRTKRNVAKSIPKVKPGQADPRPVPDRVYQKARMRATDRERIWLELAHDHGLRRGEVAVVHSDDVYEDLVGHSLLVHGKGGKTRTVPLTPSMATKLLALEPGWAFPGDDDGHLSARWIGRRVTLLLGGTWTMHKLRHSAGTAFYLHGDLAIAQRLLGHASPATTMIYVKLPDERLRATVLAAAS